MLVVCQAKMVFASIRLPEPAVILQPWNPKICPHYPPSNSRKQNFPRWRHRQGMWLAQHHPVKAMAELGTEARCQESQLLQYHI